MIVSIGEIVWDIIGEKKLLGGAPLNVAYHLASFGLEVYLVGRVGNDELAETTLRHIADIGLSIQYIQQDTSLPTGRVLVNFNIENEPSFDIVAPAAWDTITSEPFLASVSKPFHLVFGSLAQRAVQSREAIRQLRDKAELLFYDVNLRPPYTSADIVLDSLNGADIVKLNDDELIQVADWSGISPGSMEQRALDLSKKWKLLCLAVTRGPSGAMLVAKETLYTHPGFPVQVADTVGAGDAFFATLIEGILNKRPWMECLANANKRGAYVAGKVGATPSMRDFVF